MRHKRKRPASFETGLYKILEIPHHEGHEDHEEYQ